ncbi:flagellar biosynthetic protein FliQ [Vibrio marisflavi]|uniref:Flagellar biosynthetic protein FliQ n=1 Tax=Vibrio marisflavi CECT 7928 TaxID=634439 RepID=A0ABN8E9J8_9VIBR|nr:flagellar biosynthetic protein FliQ [Vibrio marisflavi]CAH0540097.1 hypothetical protein VMF7928_02614 [Vibrio marisflavi CECT 7928]
MDIQSGSIVFRQALWLASTLVTFVVLPGLLIGLVISLFQAATQVNEQTLSFLPKLLITFAAIGFGGHWMLYQLVNFCQHLFISIPQLIN